MAKDSYLWNSTGRDRIRVHNEGFNDDQPAPRRKEAERLEELQPVPREGWSFKNLYSTDEERERKPIERIEDDTEKILIRTEIVPSLFFYEKMKVARFARFFNANMILTPKRQ
jgi:hypothetical protein